MSTSSGPLGVPQPPRHRYLAWPSTRTGMRAASLSAGVVGFFVLGTVLAAARAYDGPTAARIALGVTGFAVLLGSLVALVMCVLALRKGDRSAVLLWPLLLGAFALMFVVGEFVFPH